MKKYYLLFAPLLMLGACDAPPSGAPGAETPMAHYDLEQNYKNAASACFSPVITGEAITCKYINKFEHHRLTYTILYPFEGKNYKVQYKAKFYEKEGLSCIDYNINKSTDIRVYTTNDNSVEISDTDMMIDNTPISNKIVADVVAKVNAMPKTCGKYYLTETDNPKMTYRVRYAEYQNGKEVPPKNILDNTISFYSFKSGLEFAKQ